MRSAKKPWRRYFAGSVAAHLGLAATALLFRSDLDAHAPRVLYAEILAPSDPVPAASAAPAVAAKPRERKVEKTATDPAPSPAPEKKTAAEPAAKSEAAGAAAAIAGDEGKAGTAIAGPVTEAQGSELNVYVGRVIDLLNRARVYPRDALAREEEGTVMLELNVAGDGSLTEERVIKGSGYPSLDRAALQCVQRVGRFPPPPSALHLHVPIRFQIRGR